MQMKCIKCCSFDSINGTIFNNLIENLDTVHSYENCNFHKSNNLRALIQFFNLFNNNSNNNNNKYQRMFSIKKSPYLIAFIIQADIIKRKKFWQKNDWFFLWFFLNIEMDVCYPKEKSSRIDFEGTKDPTEFNWYNNNGTEQQFTTSQ